MKHLLSMAGALSACLPALAQAAPSVYPGCALPSLKAGHHTFYVDPLKGSSQGDGSSARPWRTLAEVLNFPSKLIATQVYTGTIGSSALKASNPTGPIKSGDVIMLLSGDHGNVNVQSAINTDFITIMPAPGQKPVITSLRFQADAKWMFQGLKFMSGTDRSTSAVVTFNDNSSDLILDNSVIETVDDTSGWQLADWNAKAKNTGVSLAGSCMAVTNSHILNVVNGMGIGSTKTLVQGNTIDHMMNDGIDFVSSDLIIKQNTIKDGANVPGSALHADAIQGWSLVVNGVPRTNNNDVIDSNTILKTGPGNQSYMQGISIYDGKWDKLTVTNNSVAVNTWNAIVLSGPQNSTVINNTVFNTDTNNGSRARLSIATAKDKTQPANTTVRNNIAQELVAVGTNMAVDHNIASYMITLSSGYVTKGTIGTSNNIVTTVGSGFVSANPTTGSFDLRLRNGSAAIGAGSASGAPKVDIVGNARTVPVDNGAYQHVAPVVTTNR